MAKKKDYISSEPLWDLGDMSYMTEEEKTEHMRTLAKKQAEYEYQNKIIRLSHYDGIGFLNRTSTRHALFITLLCIAGFICIGFSCLVMYIYSGDTLSSNVSEVTIAYSDINFEQTSIDDMFALNKSNPYAAKIKYIESDYCDALEVRGVVKAIDENGVYFSLQSEDSWNGLKCYLFESERDALVNLRKNDIVIVRGIVTSIEGAKDWSFKVYSFEDVTSGSKSEIEGFTFTVHK